MKPITQYNDYRQYMCDFYEERKRSSYFTWRKFASLAGFVSPTYLKLVCDGKTRLSKPGIAKVARAMGLEGFDYTYFAPPSLPYDSFMNRNPDCFRVYFQIITNRSSFRH